MKHTYYSSLFSMYAQIAAAFSGAHKQKKNKINPVFDRLGIKFDIISAGKLYPGGIAIKRFSRFEAEGYDEPSLM
jgi:hypothetical protein